MYTLWVCCLYFWRNAASWKAPDISIIKTIKYLYSPIIARIVINFNLLIQYEAVLNRFATSSICYFFYLETQF